MLKVQLKGAPARGAGPHQGDRKGVWADVDPLGAALGQAGWTRAGRGWLARSTETCCVGREGNIAATERHIPGKAARCVGRVGRAPSLGWEMGSRPAPRPCV